MSERPRRRGPRPRAAGRGCSPSPRIGIRRPSRIQSKRISNTPSRSGPMNVFGRMITTSSPRRPNSPRELLGLDLRLAVPPDPDERIVLDDRMPLGDAVDGGRRDQDDAPNAGGERAREHVRGALDVDRANRCARRLDRQRRRGVHEHVRAVDEGAHVLLGADVAADLLYPALELGGRRAAPRRACARCRRRQARGARDGARGSRPHRRSRPASRVQGSPGQGCSARVTDRVPPAGSAGGGRSLTSTAATSSTSIATMLSPIRLRRSAPGVSPRSSRGRTKK